MKVPLLSDFIKSKRKHKRGASGQEAGRDIPSDAGRKSGEAALP